LNRTESWAVVRTEAVSQIRTEDWFGDDYDEAY
jgi:hypothetical protein